MSLSRTPAGPRTARARNTASIQPPTPIASSSALPLPSTSSQNLSPASASTSRFQPPRLSRSRVDRVWEEASVGDVSGTTNGRLSMEHLDGLRRQSNLSTLSISPRRPSTKNLRSSAKGKASATRNGRSRFDESEEMMSDPSFQDRDMMHDETLEDDLADGDEEQDDEWNMVDRMRNWRNDAMTQHLYGTAGFWGGKVFGLTGNPNDAFWLAQTHFLTHQFAQAERLLTALRAPVSVQVSPSASPSSPPYSSVLPHVRLTDTSLACRYLAAQCQVRLGKWEEALEMVGRGSDSWGTSQSTEAPSDGGVKFTASTAHLRGLIHLHLGAADLAKEAFMEALSRDVKCFESFETLVGGEMMSAEEEWEFIQGLDYLPQTGEDADFVRMMYTVRLKKVKHHKEMTIVRKRLTEEYGLGDDPDVLFGLADELYTGLRFAECYQVTTKILSLHSSHRPTLPLHLSCMHHLPHLRSRLFLLAHEMVESEPDDAISWYAVGLWYFTGRRWEESRRYFGKSVLIDSRFGPAWIAFAHSYAFEGEHDQAITAYATALKHFQGSHLPLLFIGMQHLGLKNIGLSEEYCEAAKVGGESDASVWNELGVIAYHKQKYESAIQHFTEALRLSKSVQGSPAAWATTRLNLGHAYRKLKRLPEAYASYHRVIQLDPRSAAAYSGLGLVEHQLGRYQESIARYHEALTLSPSDPLTSSLLQIVLTDVSNLSSSSSTSFLSPSPALPLLPSPASPPSKSQFKSKPPIVRTTRPDDDEYEDGPREFTGMSHSTRHHLDSLVAGVHESILRGDNEIPSTPVIPTPTAVSEEGEGEWQREESERLLEESGISMEGSTRDEETREEEEVEEGEGVRGAEESGTEEGDSMSMQQSMDMD